MYCISVSIDSDDTSVSI